MFKITRRGIRIISSVIFFSVVVLSTSRAAFEDVGVGCRPLGMGNAFVAVADDINATYYNPAGHVHTTGQGDASRKPEFIELRHNRIRTKAGHGDLDLAATEVS